MKKDTTIKLLSRREIDDAKWNGVIDNAHDGLLYASTLFLDNICPNWKGLIFNDYEYIMPIPWRKKLGVPYLYQPIGMGQGGIFSTKKITKEIEEIFITKIIESFSYGHINLNENFATENIKNCKIKKRNNYILKLDKDYNTLFKNYNEDGRKNVSRAKKQKQYIDDSSTPDSTFKIYISQYAEKMNFRKFNKDFKKLVALLDKLTKSGEAINICVKNKDGLILASAVFVEYKNRLYYLLGAPTKEGRKFKSMHLIVDAIIEKYASTNYILDFEGSDIPSVATFYQKFGTEKRIYKSLHFNNLPTLIKLFKK